MEPVAFTHNLWLVAASLCVALMAGFTGLSLTKGLSAQSAAHRKVVITFAAVALGGGIWSMHFVAMLGLQLPFVFYYDAAITLASALVAILVVGLALLMLHFGRRTRQKLVLAGAVVGVGIIAMHYIGMSALEMCRAVYTPLGMTLSILSSVVLSVVAFGIAYGKRKHRNILLGTAVFGGAVFAVHFIAVAGTRFEPLVATTQVGPLIGNEALAIGVVLSSFALCGAFLLSTTTFLPADPVAEAKPAPQPAPDAAMPAAQPEPDRTPDPVPGTGKVPYEHDGRTHFVDAGSVAAIRAEGHYTYIYTRTGHFFCAWSIAEAAKRLAGANFIQTHRSYLVNPAMVSGFERLKDTGVCYFGLPDLTKVPVSRSRLKDVREVLGV
ncbi:MHYT domain-containing protein [Pseudoprimorskyibacter insulae]|uniref:CO-responsive transcriptional regulator RcoM n=1 Tax=Pseudoprimorskyibacter insulae TaxID=1695997 RepID=A0A2R8AQ78_9RHOB|nr:MHYT domain-containing protein [Pseudoprimorskyibacter insulae]SPF78175.1 CO-responsive transcriptional regulator RcoM [Pseudoprimorskyibacter insulae]